MLMLPMKKADTPKREECLDVIIGKDNLKERKIVNWEQTSNLSSKHILHFSPKLNHTAMFKSSTPALTSSTSKYHIGYILPDAVNDHQSFQLLIPSCQQRLHCRRQNIFFSALVSLYKKKQFGRAYDAIDVRKIFGSGTPSALLGRIEE